MCNMPGLKVNVIISKEMVFFVHFQLKKPRINKHMCNYILIQVISGLKVNVIISKEMVFCYIF